MQYESFAELVYLLKISLNRTISLRLLDTRRTLVIAIMALLDICVVSLLSRLMSPLNDPSALPTHFDSYVSKSSGRRPFIFMSQSECPYDHFIGSFGHVKLDLQTDTALFAKQARVK